MAEPLPKLRPVEAYPIQQDGQPFLCLRDPQRFAPGVVTVSLGAIPILRSLDGKHSLEDIQQAFTKATSQNLPAEQLHRFLDKLDEALLLDSPRFRAHVRELLRSYRASPVRKAAHAGQSYPSDPSQITRLFHKHFEPPKGPGRRAATTDTPPRAIVAPHIDLRRGGPGFAWAYGQLAGAPKVDTFLILGVAHGPTKHRFAGCRKDFETPLGLVRTDQALLKALAENLPFDLFEDELAHRTEHSVEFQVVYLQHVLGREAPFQIVPILVGSFHEMIESGEEPIRHPQVAAFAQALRRVVTAPGKKVCVVAGVDLAHVGGRFGDEFSVNQGVLEQLAADDREMLGRLEACDAAGFFRMIHEEQDCRRICGFAALYTMLSALDLKQGRLLYYDQSVEKDTNSVVSFASMVFH